MYISVNISHPDSKSVRMANFVRLFEKLPKVLLPRLVTVINNNVLDINKNLRMS